MLHLFTAFRKKSVRYSIPFSKSGLKKGPKVKKRQRAKGVFPNDLISLFIINIGKIIKNLIINLTCPIAFFKQHDSTRSPNALCLMPSRSGNLDRGICPAWNWIIHMPAEWIVQPHATPFEGFKFDNTLLPALSHESTDRDILRPTFDLRCHNNRQPAINIS